MTTGSAAMKLTYDTLLHMTSLYTYAGDAIPLITTCRFLYHEGSKIALKKPVVIFDADELASFLKFLRADNSARSQHLRHLELWGFCLTPDLVRELLETLPLLVGLQCLRLINGEELFECDSSLPTAFATLTSLRHVYVCGADLATCVFLSSLRSPIVSAAIDFGSESTVELWERLAVDQWPKYHPVTLLVNLSPSLEELKCVSWSKSPETAIQLEEVYVNMRKLSIELHDMPLLMEPFIRAFPNLTDLHVLQTGTYLDDLDLDAIRASREANVARQQLTSCGTWTRLEHFSGELVDLYAIGLTCRIIRITIDDRVDDEVRLDMLATALRYAQPVHLKLKGIPGSMLDDTERGFSSMLRSGCDPSLLNLDLCIYFDAEDRDKDLRVPIDNLMSAVACLHLRFLRLRFDTGNLDPTQTTYHFGEIDEMTPGRQRPLYPPNDPAPAPLTPAELSLNSLDMDALMGRLESIPSLEAALILLPSSRRGEPNFERTITKGTSRLAGQEQWQSWLHGKHRFVIED